MVGAACARVVFCCFFPTLYEAEHRTNWSKSQLRDVRVNLVTMATIGEVLPFSFRAALQKTMAAYLANQDIQSLQVPLFQHCLHPCFWGQTTWKYWGIMYAVCSGVPGKVQGVGNKREA